MPTRSLPHRCPRSGRFVRGELIERAQSRALYISEAGIMQDFRTTHKQRPHKQAIIFSQVQTGQSNTKSTTRCTPTVLHTRVNKTRVLNENPIVQHAVLSARSAVRKPAQFARVGRSSLTLSMAAADSPIVYSSARMPANPDKEKCACGSGLTYRRCCRCVCVRARGCVCENVRACVRTFVYMPCVSGSCRGPEGLCFSRT